MTSSDIVIEQEGRKPKSENFKNISDKMTDILEISLGKSLDYHVHYFELIKTGSSVRSIITSFGQQIDHLSIIFIHCRPQMLSRGRMTEVDQDVRFLLDHEPEIKIFSEICKIIDPEWNFNKNRNKKWRLITDRLFEKGVISDTVDSLKCQVLFNEIASFYIRTFDKLNLRLESPLQNTFNLMKAIHKFKRNEADKGLIDKSLFATFEVIRETEEIVMYERYGDEIYSNSLIRSLEPEQIVTID